MSTYQELIAQRAALEKQHADLEKQIADTLKAERSNVISQIKTLMSDHGITSADLGGKVGRPPKAVVAGGAPVRKVAAKFRDPSTGESWSGRGLKPKWLTAALETGRTIEEFLI